MKAGMNRQRGAVFLMIAAMLSVLTVGCTSGGGETEPSVGPGDGSSAKPQGTASPAAGNQYPATLTNWIPIDPDAAATMKNLNETALYKELEKRTGTKVEFMNPALAAAGDQFNLLLASGDLPDVIQYYWNQVARGPDNAIKEKTIIRLNELIDSHAPNLSKLLKEHPEYRKLITTDEGNIYEIPYLNGDSAARVYLGINIRKDWLDKLKLQMPTTIDEWHTVLKAFKEQDPNGNGKQDEIPFLLNTGFLENWSGAWGIGVGFYQDKGKVKYGPIEPKFKELLTTIRQWYMEGLIDKDYAATDDKLRDAKVANHLLGTFEVYVASGLGRYMDLVKPQFPAFELAGAPFPVMNKGDVSKFGTKGSPFAGFGAAISSKNKNPEATVRWLDYAFGPEGHMLYNFGVEGQSYTKVDGYPKFTDQIMKNPNKLSVSQALLQYAVSNSVGTYLLDGRVTEQLASMPQQKQAKQAWGEATGENLLPLLSPTQQESTKLSSIMNDITTYYSEMINKFIMGTEPLDKFDQFVSTIKGMGIEEAIKLQQSALDRFNKR
ncbi:MAG: transporter substrate-binding protein [Paenibacillus sp.]|nr:transporter substrate-binding protein [Paenibacillus sp.]